MGAGVRWRWATLAELTTEELYALMELRQQVFVVEQQCVYLDADGHDRVALHGLGTRDGALVACARILPAGITFPTPSIGRVATASSQRGSGLGRALMIETLRETQQRFPGEPITIAAQAYLTAFYERLGFRPIGEPYDEDGIMHVDMVRPATS